jgi:arginyl-tRNA synthetase
VTPAALAELVRSTAVDVLSSRGLDSGVLAEPVTVELPRNPEHGDYASNVALRTAGKLGVPPREFAGWLAEALTACRDIASVDVAGPGFLNVRLTDAARGALVRDVLAQGQGYGRCAGTSAALLERANRCVIERQQATLAGLRKEIGGDAARYAVLRSPVHQVLEIDLDVWSTRTDVNPLFRVQYAHSRLAALLRNAADLGIEVGEASSTDLGLLTHQAENHLIRALGEFPPVVSAAAALREPHRVARYLEELAGAYYRFHDSCRVLPQGDQEPTPLTRARLRLCAAARRVLASGLALLEVNAPELI